MEQPFLFTDLIPPDELSALDNSKLEQELKEGSIPIKTWTNGSPFRLPLSFRPDLDLKPAAKTHSASASTDGMMNYTYSEGMHRLEAEDEDTGYCEGDNSTTDQLYQDDASMGNDEYNHDSMEDEEYIRDDEVDPDEDDRGDADVDDDNEYLMDSYDDYEDSVLRSSSSRGTSGVQMNISGFVRLNESNDEPNIADVDDYELVHRDEDETGDELVEEWESFPAVALSREETAFLSDSVGSDDATDEQIQDLVAIMNEYNELVQYMNSPRKSISKADTSSSSAAFIAGESPRSRWKGSDGIEDGQSSRRSLPRGTQEAILSALADQHQQQPRVLEGQILRRKKQQQQQQKKKKKTKLFGYAREQQQQLAIQQKIAYNNNMGGGAAIDDKQRAILADIVEKRKKEEEDAARAAEKALQKRRKFKEALLEKALRAREQQQEKVAAAAEIAAAAEEAPVDHRHQQQQQRSRSKVDTTPMFPAINNGGGKKGKKEQQPSSVAPSAGFLAPTKSFQVVMESAKANALPTPADLTEEDAARAEEERREHVASIRRKFKEQHKQILQALQSKHKEDERKAVEEQIKDAVRKEKYRLKLMRMIAEKQGKEEQLLQAATTAATAASLSSDGGGAPPIDDAMEPRKPSQQQRLVLPSILRTKSQHTNEEEVDIDDDNRLAHCKQQAPKSAAGSSVSSGEVAAGSALSAIRRRFRSKSATAAPECELKPVAEESQLIDNDTGEGKQQPIRSVVSKEQQEKLASYLHTLSEQRRKEEQDRKREEDRMRRRAALLSARLLQEAADRKLLLAEGGGVVQESRQSNDDDSDEQQQQEAAVSGVLASTPVKGSHKPTAKSNGRKHLTESISEATPAAAAADHCCTTSSPGTEKKKVKFTQDMADKVVSRLHTSKADHQADADKENNNINSTGTLISGCNVPVRDFADWKRKNSVSSDAMVFSMTGWYPCVRDALLGRGWVQNPDINSPHAHLKWTLRSIDVNHDSLQPWQLTNHFAKNVAITTKVGLLKSLQSLVWLADVDVDAILPRGYDLSNPVDMQAFIDDFRCQRAEGLLKGIYHRVTGLELPVLGRKQLSAVSEDGVLQPDTIQMDSYDQTHNSSNSSSCEEEEEELLPPTPPVQVGVALDSVRVNAAVFDATCSILEKYIRPLDDSYIDEKDINDAATKDITDLEWELISNYDLHSSFPSLPIVIPEPIDSFLREKVDPDAKLSQQQKWDRRRMQRIEQDLREAASTNLSVLRPLTSEDLQRIHVILCTLLRHNQSQTGLNGKGSNSLNMWIVKPAAKSRGRGIATFMDLSKLLKCVDAGTGRFSQWVVQKYVENPLVIAKRKFDLRQWVLVTNWNPLTIYFYDECYARFSVDEYSTEVCDLDNSYVHLVNNSIGKNSERFNDVVVAENGRKLDGFMWSFEHFSEYVTFKSGQDLVKSKIHPRMKDIAKWSLMCASEMIEHRKNSWELYGFDFMVDDEYNAWLIEINSSPACDYSTTVTERYVQKALVELLSVVLDCREWEAQPKKTRGPSPDTGGWERIYQGPLLEIPVGSFGTEMSLKGEAFKQMPPAGRTNGSHVHNFSFTRSVSDDADRATDDAEVVPSERTSAHRVPAEGDRRSSKHTGVKSLGGNSSGSSSYNPVKSISSSKARHEERSHEKVISEVVQVTDETERFDDSDDDDPKRISSSSKVAEIVLKSPPPDTVVVGSTRRPTQLKPPSGRQPLSAAMASIPIKVFAVDF